jgi:hypothetical protein
MNIPDPLARDGSRPLLAPVGLVLAALIALPTIPLSRPEGFNHIAGYVLCRTTACTLALTPNLPPVDSPSRRGRPGIMQVFDPRGITKKVSTTKFTIPPLWPEETHPPLRPQVESISLTAFMLASPGIPQGTAPAEPGEKLILYLHGG